ncbi:hypothetical protein [Jeongeupia naejangsanensis]|uniref:DUF2541 family protein n=1 Tax=Jeongeupia naejangsanensis TaxID=613195 RepID=A0ABS2BMZ2_9NEIS|nr:hypothetical protein [Jeongeupia naejangsanensis]MBM3116979.1 hypothetical protein [Jeongeupia naejangsanensis]
MLPSIRRTAGLLLMLGALVSTGAHANSPNPGAPGSWRVLGTTHASLGQDHDTIVVQGPYDNFRRLKFRVSDAPLNMQHMTVTYDNGGRDNIEVRQAIAQGGESRIIDLRGAGKRSVRRVDFWYDTRGKGHGKADVTLFGMK